MLRNVKIILYPYRFSNERKINSGQNKKDKRWRI